MRYLIICGNKSIGGTGTVISILERTLNASILYLESSVYNNFKSFEKAKADIYVAIQPMAIFYMLLWKFARRKKKIVFIFDAHPLGFVATVFDYITKALPYYLISLLSWQTVDRRFLIVPDGPLSNFYPYKNFTICAWEEFIENRFIGCNSAQNETCLLYYGTPSKAKRFISFLSLHKDNKALSLKVVGYKTKLLDVYSNLFNYCGKFNGKNINLTSDIMVWTSRHESYGLSFREYISSRGRLLFLRPFLNSDRIENGIYLDLKTPNFKNLNILNILVKFPQKNLPSDNIKLSNYLKNEIY
jgi:hypothetical protein